MRSLGAVTMLSFGVPMGIMHTAHRGVVKCAAGKRRLQLGSRMSGGTCSYVCIFPPTTCPLKFNMGGPGPKIVLLQPFQSYTSRSNSAMSLSARRLTLSNLYLYSTGWSPRINIGARQLLPSHAVRFTSRVIPIQLERR